MWTELEASGWAGFHESLGEEHFNGAHAGNPHPQCEECQGEE